jgi:hypothetical protein
MADALKKDQLAAMLTAFAAALTTPFIRLFTGTHVPNPNTVLADIPEPTGTWYTAVAAVYDQVYQHPDGSMEIRPQAVQFNYTGSSPAEVITGWAVVDTAGPTLLHAHRLDTPVTMGTTLDSVIVEPSLVLPAVTGS